MSKLLKPFVFLICLLPLGTLVFATVTGNLGANPIETITLETGEWTLRFLLLTLCATPLRRLSGWGWPVRIRRMLGLYAFFYVSLHFTTYLWLDQFFNWFDILIDIGKRPFITVGFSAFVLLIPLAVTSNRVMIRKLGRKWKPLHSLVYPISVFALLHYVWLVKADLLKPTIYLIILILLLGYRLVVSLSQQKVVTVKPSRAYGSDVKEVLQSN